MRKTGHFLALNVNISKMVGDSKLPKLGLSNRKSHVRFPLASKSMTLTCYNFDRILSEFRGISRIWEPTTAKRLKIDHCLRRNCSLLNADSACIVITLILHGFFPLGASNKGGVGKQVIFELNASISRKR